MEIKYLSRLSQLAECFGLTAIYAFGSRSREAAALIHGKIPFLTPADSDLDLAVQPLSGRNLSAREKVEISTELEALFEVGRVDLVVLKEAKPFLALEIIKGELLYCNDLDRQAEEELYVLRQAGDLAYYERERRKMILQGESR
jgi:predicted nucleotidyltransferase